MLGLEVPISLEKGLLLGSGRITTRKLSTKTGAPTKVLIRTGQTESPMKAAMVETKNRKTVSRSTVEEMESGTITTAITTCHSSL